VKGKKYVRVDITTDCYGAIEREIRVVEEEEWRTEKEAGYYMA